VLATGEELPQSVSDSTPGRLVVVRVPPGALVKSVLIECMSQAETLRLSMSGYVTWLQAHPDVMESALSRRDALVAVLDPEVSKVGPVHARVGRNVATLLAGIQIFIAYALDIGAIEQADADRRTTTAKEALIVVGRAQLEATSETSPVDRFVATLHAVLSNGTRTLARRDEPLVVSDLGWDDPEHGRVYLAHDLAWHAIQTWHREADSEWPYNKTSLQRTLVERGIARDGRDPGHPGLHKVRVGAGSKPPAWVLDIDRAVLEPALRGESAHAQAARHAAAEAEAEDAVAHLNRHLPN
jgi:hypothetical protein